MKNLSYHNGMNLDKALREAAHRGWEVRPVRRTGEVDVIATAGQRVRLNGRRKDAPRALTALLRRNDLDRDGPSTLPALAAALPPAPMPPSSGQAAG